MTRPGRPPRGEGRAWDAIVAVVAVLSLALSLWAVVLVAGVAAWQWWAAPPTHTAAPEGGTQG